MVEDENHPVHAPAGIQLGQPVGDGLGVEERRFVGDAKVGVGHRLVLEAKGARALLAHHDQVGLHALCSVRPHELLGGAHDVRVEGPAQSSVGGQSDHGHAAHLVVLREEGEPFGVHLDVAGHAGDELVHAYRVGPGGLDALRRPTKSGRRHHLHGLGDLLRVLDGADPPLDISLTRHSRPWLSLMRRPRRPRRHPRPRSRPCTRGWPRAAWRWSRRTGPSPCGWSPRSPRAGPAGSRACRR